MNGWMDERIIDGWIGGYLDGWVEHNAEAVSPQVFQTSRRGLT